MLLNRDRAAELMAEHDVSALVASTLENVAYLSEHEGWVQRVYRDRKNYAVLVRDPAVAPGLVLNGADVPYYATRRGSATTAVSFGGKSALVVPAGYEAANREERLYLDLHESCDKFATAVDALVHVLAELGHTHGRIVVDDVEGSAIVSALRSRLPGSVIVSGPSLFLMIRLVKTADDLARLRAAAIVNEESITAMLAVLRPGITENEAAAVWRAAVAERGGMWHWFHFGSGPRSVYNFPPTERSLRPGDLFFFDAGLFHRDYNADTGGCGSVGEPPAEDLRNYRAIEAGIDAALEIVRAGVTGGRIYQAMVDGIRKSGMPEFKASFAGHTIGLEAREFPFTLAPEVRYSDPFLPATSELPLPANATINIEAPMGIMGHGGYQIERSIIVKDGGWEPLIEQQRGFTVVEG